jgi:hypothetical protein
MPFSDTTREIKSSIYPVRVGVTSSDSSDLATPQTTTTSTPNGAVNTYSRGYIDLDVVIYTSSGNGSVTINPGLWNDYLQGWSYTGGQVFSTTGGTTVTSLRIDPNNRPLWPKVTAISGTGASCTIYQVGGA